MEEIGKNWKKIMLIHGHLFATHGYLFDNRWPHFLKMLINCEQLKFFENFGRKIQKNRSKKMSFLLSKFLHFLRSLIF